MTYSSGLSGVPHWWADAQMTVSTTDYTKNQTTNPSSIEQVAWETANMQNLPADAGKFVNKQLKLDATLVDFVPRTAEEKAHFDQYAYLFIENPQGSNQYAWLQVAPRTGAIVVGGGGPTGPGGTVQTFQQTLTPTGVKTTGAGVPAPVGPVVAPSNRAAAPATAPPETPQNIPPATPTSLPSSPPVDYLPGDLPTIDAATPAPEGSIPMWAWIGGGLVAGYLLLKRKDS